MQRRVPKYGFSKRSYGYERMAYVNIEKILYCIQRGRLNPTETITIRSLVECGAISHARFGVQLLGRVACSSPRRADFVLRKPSFPTVRLPCPRSTSK